MHGFRHEALFYDGEQSFVPRALPFVLDGVASGDAVLVAVPEPNLSALRAELGATAKSIAFEDMAIVGRNPGRIISLWDDFAHAHDGMRLRGLGEPLWNGRSVDEVTECEIHEELLDLAFAHAAALHLVCPYDVAALPQQIVNRARAAHESGGSAGSPLREPIRPAPDGAHRETFDATGIRGLRRRLGDLADHVGVAPPRIDDLVLAVNEVVTNSVVHGGGRGTLRVWIDGEAVVCEVADHGCISDPLVGRRRPSSDSSGGRGLWLAQQLCDLVQIRSDAAGTVVRMRVNGTRLR